MTVLYSETSIVKKQTWRKNGIHEENSRGYLMDGQNLAGVTFDVVLAGTVMALKANGKARPSGAAQNQAAQVGVNIINVDDASNLYLSDVATVYEPDGTVIAAARNVTAVDKTSTPNTVTVDGAVLTTVEDGFVLVDGGYIPIGILEDQPDTIRRVSGSNVEREHLVTVGQEGNAQESRVIGMVDLTKKMLAGGMLEVATTFDGMPADGQFQSLVAGFLFS